MWFWIAVALANACMAAQQQHPAMLRIANAVIGIVITLFLLGYVSADFIR